MQVNKNNHENKSYTLSVGTQYMLRLIKKILFLKKLKYNMQPTLCKPKPGLRSPE